MRNSVEFPDCQIPVTQVVEMLARNFIIFLRYCLILKIVQKCGRDCFGSFEVLRRSVDIFGIPIEIGETNNNTKRNQNIFQMCERGSFGRLVVVRVGVERNWLANL